MGVKNYVCCSGGPFTFSLTGGGETKQSTCNNCGSEGNWDGSVTLIPGAKQFTWTASGSNCKHYSGQISHIFLQGKSYLFKALWTGSTVVVEVQEFDL